MMARRDSIEVRVRIDADGVGGGIVVSSTYRRGVIQSEAIIEAPDAKSTLRAARRALFRFVHAIDCELDGEAGG